MRLGRTQQVIYDHVDAHPCQTAQEIGDALYDKVSVCANWKSRATPRDKLRKQWTQKVLRQLAKDELLVCDNTYWKTTKLKDEELAAARTTPKGKARRRVDGFLVYEEGEKCAHCGKEQRQGSEDSVAGYVLECPQCYRPGCEECMPAGRGCVCPQCEDENDMADNP